MCEIRKRGNHPSKIPGLSTAPPPRSSQGGLAPLRRPARPKYSPAAGPLDVTAPSYPLLNFKPRAEEQPGGGGFLRSWRLSHARGRHFSAPRVPCIPEDPALQLPRRGPEPTAAPGVVAGAGYGRGGARAVECGCALAAPPLRPPAPREGGGEEPTSAAGNPPPAEARVSLALRCWALAALRPPYPWLQHPGRARPGRAGARELRGWEGVSRKPKQGGKEEEAPTVVSGTGGPAGRGLTGGLTDSGGLPSRGSEWSGAAR